MKKAIFLDRDGTLNVDSGYVYKVEDFLLHDGVIEGLQKLKGFLFFIVTNQSGIGRGFYSEEDMHKFNSRLILELKKNDIEISQVYFCPHIPSDSCNCRKPSSKYILDAKEKFDLNLSLCWVIGDHACDVNFAKNSGCNSVYLLTGHGVKHLEEAKLVCPDYVAADMTQAADFINFKDYNKIISRDKLTGLINEIKKTKKRIVTLNGTFDILHNGHEKILLEARAQGDVLIVGLNSDSSVKSNKGPKRPLNNEFARAKMLARYNFVDYVTIFNEKTPIDLLEIIKPDIHVNGSEYGENCIEAETVIKNGGKIHVVNLLSGYSTTSLISG